MPDQTTCSRCGHLEAHHHPTVGCLNRHCRCKDYQWYENMQATVSVIQQEHRAAAAAKKAGR